MTPIGAAADPTPTDLCAASVPQVRERSRVACAGEMLLATACFALVLVVNRSVPFVSLPQVTVSLGWVGFAEDIASTDLLRPFSHHLGFPARIPLAFGLSGVWPMAVLVRAGLPAADAYVVVEAAFLFAAFVGAIAFGRALGAGRGLAIGMSAVWLTLPVVWVSTSYYMMTGWGFALLPG